MIDEYEKVGQGTGEGDAQLAALHPKRVINFILVDPTETHGKIHAEAIYGEKRTRGMSYRLPLTRGCPLLWFEASPKRNIDPAEDDALMVTFHLSDYLVKRILVDNGSSKNLLLLLAFKEMDLLEKKLVLNITTLIGFNGKSTRSMGEISLPRMD